MDHPAAAAAAAGFSKCQVFGTDHRRYRNIDDLALAYANCRNCGKIIAMEDSWSAWFLITIPIFSITLSRISASVSRTDICSACFWFSSVRVFISLLSGNVHRFYDR